MTEALDVALVSVAALFAVFSGANDGGSLLSTSLKMASLRPLTAAAMLSVTVVVAPAIFGSQVATTLADRLVSFQGENSRLALLIAVVSATVVVAGLSHRGMPTSLTLALIGGILGAGLGGGLRIGWDWVLLVLLLAGAAPFVGLLGSFAVARLWGSLPLRARIGRQVHHAHRVGFALQAFAYGTNDGQKMLAVSALALPAGADAHGVQAPAWMLLAIGVLFATGMLLGVRRHGARLGSALLPITPVNAVTAQLSSAGAVLGSAAVGAPVSMTQAVTGGLVGSALVEGAARVRWQQAAGIVAAWLLTLPSSALLAALPAAVLVRS